ncbi:ead/Ea22-like family protein [Paenalcaligenes niemegkensis]|uniref:ead/Ea22-like family protein n=1 Tax=Paenalcaligenes niemegkensis TaxID=2895469 RepID=UPI001EE98DDF|nr:ead/Ea22-like family protein [Paenalcaligenes niemegkensis]MCQ9618351.1 ead/Ea22-like family protein [Paenalcaligenes niemegkensis]
MTKYQALRDAVGQATPGEWSIGPSYTDDDGYIELPIYSVVDGQKTAPMAIALQFPYVRGMQEANAAFVTLAHNLTPDLLAERDEHAAEIARLRALVSEMADNDTYEIEYDDGRMYSVCHGCSAQDDDEHNPNCLYVRARAALPQ